jgi:hypothetical protein
MELIYGEEGELGKFLFLRERPGGLINFSQIEKLIASPAAAPPERPGKES